jgi:hypothetical protein
MSYARIAFVSVLFAALIALILSGCAPSPCSPQTAPAYESCVAQVAWDCYQAPGADCSREEIASRLAACSRLCVIGSGK